MASDRASVMVYVVRGENDDDAWYIEFTFKVEEWQISKLTGVDRAHIDGLLRADVVFDCPPPWHGEKPMGAIGVALDRAHRSMAIE